MGFVENGLAVMSVRCQKLAMKKRTADPIDVACLILQFVMNQFGLLYVWVIFDTWERYLGTVASAFKWFAYAGTFALLSFRIWEKEVQRRRDAEVELGFVRKSSMVKRVFAGHAGCLLSHYEDRGIAADIRVSKYLEKWITIKGNLEGFSDSLLGDSVYVSVIVGSGKRVHLQFPVHARESLRTCHVGKSISSICQVKHAHGVGAFALENCELVDKDNFHLTRIRVS